MTVTESLLAALLANTNADDPFLIEPSGPAASPGETVHTYGQVIERSLHLAGALTASGVEPGDRVLVQVDKSVDAIALYLGCLRGGFVYVPINTAYTAAEVEYFAVDTGAKIFVCRPAGADTTAAPSATVLTMGTAGEGSLPELAERCEPLRSISERAGDDLACMLYTSGTTGRSKGAMLTHTGLLANGRALHEVWAFEPGDVLLHTLPIFHVHGLFVALHCAMLNGSSVIFLRSFDGAEVQRQLPRATVMMGVPTHYVRLMGQPSFGATDCENIRLFTSGSAPMTAPVHQQFTERSGHQIVERYGMTEVGIMTSNPVDGDRIAGSVGYALSGVELRVIDGIVQTRGPHLFAGYWQLEEKTAESFTDDGWFITGDIGVMAEDGRLTLSGRAGDLIISGGFNVYPKEIEMVLDETDGVAETAVIGVPHPDFGEGVVAVIVLQADADEPAVLANVADRCSAALARFKHPKHYVTVASLPRNAMGKVQKTALREEFSELFDPNA